jgi:hypothetical protein
MGSLREIYGNMVTKLLPYRGIEEYRKAILGFFWITREEPYFPSALYNMNNFDEILETITSQSSLNGENTLADDIDSWRSSYDPLQTSPINGVSQLNDDEIYTWVLDHMTRGDAQSNKYWPFFQDYPPITQQEISQQKIVRTNRFIDVIFKTKIGEELRYSFPTLYHKWRNLDDNIGLLRFGGTHIEKPTLTALEDSRTIAQATLDQVNQAIKSHVTSFGKVASFFANYDPQGNETSLAQRYFRWHINQEERVNTLLQTCLHP